MSFLELAKRRYSCRKYQERKVEQEKLEAILEAGRVAPTAANYQPQRVLVLQSEEGMARVAKAARTFQAPLVLIICVDRDEAWKRSIDAVQTTDIDASIVTDHMMLAAADMGLDSVWICYFNADIIREEFNLPEHYVPVNILAIGYGEGNAQSPDRHDRLRKPISQTVTYESF